MMATPLDQGSRRKMISELGEGTPAECPWRKEPHRKRRNECRVPKAKTSNTPVAFQVLLRTEKLRNSRD